MAKFALSATGSTPWFELLGKGVMKIDLPGTWAGTVAIQRRRPDGAVATYMSPDGEMSAYAANPGLVEIKDAGPVRFSFTRTSGTLEPYVWSDDGAIYFPNADAAGKGLTFLQLPTSNPAVSGALWNNSGVVTTSAG
jgi:hypothetical protein